MSSNKSVRTKSDHEFSKERHVKKSRKEHECCFCKKKIPKGSSYTRTVGVCESTKTDGARTAIIGTTNLGPRNVGRFELDADFDICIC